MAARCPGMEPPRRSTARRLLSWRGACLAVAALCALAVASGAIARSHDAGRHHHHAVAAAAAAVDTAVVTGKRSAPDLAAVERPVADAAPATARSSLHSTAPPIGAQVTSVRTRGPPGSA